MWRCQVALVGALCAALLLAGTALAAGGAPNADLNRDRVFDDLTAQLAPLAAEARVNVIVRLDGAPTDTRIAALRTVVGSFSVGRALALVDGFSAKTAAAAKAAATAKKGATAKVAAPVKAPAADRAPAKAAVPTKVRVSRKPSR